MDEVKPTTLSAKVVKAAARCVGFDDCGVAEAAPLNDYAERLDQWLAEGFHGEMQFMERYRELRNDPTQLLPAARSVICVVSGYNPTRLMEQTPRVARYAYGEDYHERMKRMLYQMIGKLRETYKDFEGRPCVDSAPVAEKWWAARAGLGWIGRNTLLIHPKLGSWLNIGEIITPSALDEYDESIANQCGDCRLCLQSCPNGALRKSGNDGDQWHTMLDARRCASYQTIENNADALPQNLRLSGFLFGCDCCQQVCPYNQHAPTCIDIDDKRLQQLRDLATCDERAFRRTARHSALSRIRFKQLERNREKLDEETTPQSKNNQDEQQKG